MDAELRKAAAAGKKRQDLRNCAPCKEEMRKIMKRQMVDQYKRLVITNWQSPGDITMLTAAVRDLHKAYPGKFETDVRTSCPSIWQENPYVTKFPEPWIDEYAAKARDGNPAIPIDKDGILFVPAQYEIVQHKPTHFVAAIHENLSAQLGLDIPCTEFKGDIHMADVEKQWMSQIAEMGVADPFWLIMPGGKWDFTAKWPNPHTLQKVVEHFVGKVLFVQVGTAGNWEPLLDNVIDLVGQTDFRMLIRLIYHAQGVIVPVNGIMHLAAAVPTPDGKQRPCVVVAGGREPTNWEAYPNHRYLSKQGSLPCCNPYACDKARCTPVGDDDDAGKDKPENMCQNYVTVDAPKSPYCRTKMDTIRVAKCIDMISAEEIIQAVESYITGGVRDALQRD